MKVRLGSRPILSQVKDDRQQEEYRIQETHGKYIDIPMPCETSLTDSERMQAESIYHKGIWFNKRINIKERKERGERIDDIPLLFGVNHSEKTNRLFVYMITRDDTPRWWGTEFSSVADWEDISDLEELALLLRYLTELYPEAAPLWKPDMEHMLPKDNPLFLDGKMEYERILRFNTSNKTEAEKREWAGKRVNCVKVRYEYSGWHDEDDEYYLFEMENGSGIGTCWREYRGAYTPFVLRLYCMREFGAETIFE